MTLPAALAQTPALCKWVVFHEDKIVVHTGKVELGQGIRTAIAMIAAEELDVSPDRIEVKTGNTATGPNEFITAGSMSIEGSGAAVRQACAEVRKYLLDRAAEQLGVKVSSLTIDAGLIRHPDSNESLTYQELMAGEQLDIEATGEATPRSPSTYRLVGTTITRLDLPAKLTGGRAFIQDHIEPGLLHGRVARGPGNSFRLLDIDTSTVKDMPGVVTVVVSGDFVGVVAENEAIAVKAKARLHKLATWKAEPASRLPADPHDFLVNHVAASLLVVDGTPTLDPIPPRLPQANALRAVYRKPYYMHGSIGPSAAVAQFQEGKLFIKSHSQGPYIIRDALAVALAMTPSDIVVEHVENAGCYGHNGADDAAMDAALLAKAVPGRPVLLKWQREDEHAWEPYSPAMVMDMEAGMQQGKISHWCADIYSQTHSGRPFPHPKVTNLVAAWQRSTPMKRAEPRPGMGNHTGIHRNADPCYDLPNKRITKNLVSDQRVRTSSTRGLGAFGNIFAIESFMDELAHSAGIDPVAFRLAHLSDPRASEVIQTANNRSKAYAPPLMPGWHIGRGLAFARYKNRQTYAAVSLWLAVNEETFDLKLLHACIAADAGLVIDRDGLANQLEGGFIQAASWTLKEAVQFGEFGTASLDWESYPILTFPEVPTVDIDILDRPDHPALGAGEATQGPTPAAIANAVYSAVELRIRDLPITPDQLRATALAQ